MIETVFFDWVLSFGVGLLFGIVGRRELESARARQAPRAVRWGFAGQSRAVIPVALALYALAPEWMWMFWVDPGRLSLGVEVFAFGMYYVSFLAGFLLAPELERLRKNLGWGVWAAGSVGLAVAAALTAERLGALGSVAEFEAGRAASFAGAPLLVAAVGLPASSVVIVLALIGLARRSRAGRAA